MASTEPDPKYGSGKYIASTKNNSEEYLNLLSYSAKALGDNSVLELVISSEVTSMQTDFYDFQNDALGEQMPSFHNNDLSLINEIPEQLHYNNAHTSPKSNFQLSNDNDFEIQSRQFNSYYSQGFEDNNYGLKNLFNGEDPRIHNSDLQLHSGNTEKGRARLRLDPYTDEAYLNTYFLNVRRRDPYLVHCQVVETYRMELEHEARYLNGEIDGISNPPRKRRRRPNEVEWKPDSIFRACGNGKSKKKPLYLDSLPRSSCFGKINMRVVNAWKRQPNKHKHRKTLNNRGSRDGLSKHHNELSDDNDPDFFGIDEIFT